MRFTKQEMILLNIILEGGPVFGIPLGEIVPGASGEEPEHTVQSLIGKGILKSKTELSPKGALPLSVLEEYKNSASHLILNHLHIAMPENGEAVVLISVAGEYDLSVLPAAALFYLVLENNPFLKGSCKEGDGVKNLEIDDFLQEVAGLKEHILLGEYQNQRLIREKVYYQKDSRGYVYDLNREVKRGMSALEMRTELLRLFGIQIEERGASSGT